MKISEIFILSTVAGLGFAVLFLLFSYHELETDFAKSQQNLLITSNQLNNATKEIGYWKEICQFAQKGGIPEIRKQLPEPEPSI